jgi:DNA-binding GntR family transcriptional regulator
MSLHLNGQLLSICCANRCSAAGGTSRTDFEEAIVTQLVLELDRSSPIPLYFQVARQMESAIETGALGPGDRLENEMDLADRLGLSRPTMRQAIHELVAKGLLVRKRGVGTLVVHRQVKRQLELTSLYDDLSRLNGRPSTEVLAHTVQPADDDVAEYLRLAPGAEVLYIERLRSTLDEPLALMRNWLPVELAPLLDREKLASRGMYELIRAGGIHMRVATQRVGARSATAREARLLGRGRGTPLLTVERSTYDDRGAAVEFARHVYRSDNYTIEFTLVDQ